MGWGGEGRKRDYKRLTEIGYDVVDARLEQVLRLWRKEHPEDGYPERTASGLVAEELGVFEFNMRMWLRRQRTVAFLAEMTDEEFLDLIAGGQSPADIAAAYDLSVKLVEAWMHERCKPEDIANAKDAMADAKFANVRREIAEASSEFQLKRAAALNAVDRHVATTTRRYSEDKNVRINAGAGAVMEISFVRRKTEETPSDG